MFLLFEGLLKVLVLVVIWKFLLLGFKDFDVKFFFIGFETAFKDWSDIPNPFLPSTK